jgi:hypothetical protein
MRRFNAIVVLIARLSGVFMFGWATKAVLAGQEDTALLALGVGVLWQILATLERQQS